MRLLVRYLLWILIAAIPLQGGAAAFMSYSGSAPAVVPEEAADAAVDVAVKASVPPGHCEKAPGNKDSKPHSKCSSCASCCVGAAAPPSVPVNPDPRPLVNASPVSPEAANIPFVPATPDRPPRHHC